MKTMSVHSVNHLSFLGVLFFFLFVSLATGSSSFTVHPNNPVSFSASIKSKRAHTSISKDNVIKFLSLRGGTSDTLPNRSTSSSSSNSATDATQTSRGSPLLQALLPSNLIFDNAPFRQYNTIMVMANVLGFIVSLVSGGSSHLHLDLIGTGAFALASIPNLIASDIQRVQLSSAFVTLWGTKLASFLFFRALKIGTDKRLEETLSTVSGTASFWIISLIWGIVCSLPHSLGATSSHNVPVLSSPCGLVGTTLFLIGLITETTADVQKWIFKQNNPGKFCNVGLWSVSQHPNFLGNILLWTGIFLLNAPALIDPPVAVVSATSVTISTRATKLFQTLWRFKRLALAALSPLMMYSFFSGQAKGSITNSQELAMKKYGNDPEYRRYIQSVPLIFPKFW